MRLTQQIHTAIRNIPLEDLIGTRVKHTELRRLFSNALRPFGVSVRIKRDDSVLASSGEYRPLEKKAIVYLHCRKGEQTVSLTERRLDRIKFVVSQNVQHELIHKQQKEYDPKPFPIRYTRLISPKRKEMIRYLNDWYEVEAYAHDIALEALYYYPGTVNRAFQSPDDHPSLKSYHIYRRWFGKTDWSEIRQTLMRTAWKWSQKLDSVDLHLTP